MQKMRAEGGKKGKGKKRKEKEKGGKNGDQNHILKKKILVRAHVFSYAQWSFFKYL